MSFHYLSPPSQHRQKVGAFLARTTAASNIYSCQIHGLFPTSLWHLYEGQQLFFMTEVKHESESRPRFGAIPSTSIRSTSQIYCTHNLPSWNMPWQRLKQEQSTSTGFVIEGKRIITNAHSVEYSTMVQVRACVVRWGLCLVQGDWCAFFSLGRYSLTCAYIQICFYLRCNKVHHPHR